MTLINALFYIIFILAAIVLVVVILLQEGKGGGLGGGLGGAGQETFGVGAAGINKFTAVVAAVFLTSAILIHYINRDGSVSSLVGPDNTIFSPDTGTGGASGESTGGNTGGNTGANTGGSTGSTGGEDDGK